ncbi:recombinase family protein [Lelliottia wanjuensis]|uniref:recombinase family protein n=1 Tax=Lelliottia wanjuensis TaxID=3050585 RepID=UPI0025507302|nr:recombinase family protein [Lelliottia sp. V86_10]MDK9586719.1 recombinase family protein [Lelliottia sp. V86_10]
MKIGYVRVSSADQNLDRQLEVMSAEGVESENIYQEKKSAKDNERPELKRMLSSLRKGDIVIVKSIDRVARSYKGFAEVWEEVQSRGAILKVCDMGLELDANNPMTKFIVGIMAQVAELERGMIRERQREGIKIAVKQGKYKGRGANVEMHKKVVQLLRAGMTGKAISETLGVHRDTVTDVKRRYTDERGELQDPS